MRSVRGAGWGHGQLVLLMKQECVAVGDLPCVWPRIIVCGIGNALNGTPQVLTLPLGCTARAQAGMHLAYGLLV